MRLNFLEASLLNGMNIASKAVEPEEEADGIDTPHVYLVHGYPGLTVGK